MATKISGMTAITAANLDGAKVETTDAAGNTRRALIGVLLAVSTIVARDAAGGIATASHAVTGSVATTALATPAAPVITQGGTAGATAYTYKVVARDSVGQSIASAGTATATGNAALTGANFNTVTWAAVTGAVSYDVYRTASAGVPATTGLIGNVLAPTLTLNDTGLAGDGSTAPTINGTGVISTPTFLQTSNGQLFGVSSAPAALRTALEAQGPNKIISYGDSVGGRARFTQATIGNANFIDFYAAGGTVAAPTAMGSSTQMGGLAAGGYDGAAWTGSGAVISMESAQIWAAGAHGSVIRVKVTKNGTTALTETALFDQDGSFWIEPISASTVALHLTGNWKRAANGAQAATINNLPAAATGVQANNWLIVDDNGTVGYIPIWH